MRCALPLSVALAAVACGDDGIAQIELALDSQGNSQTVALPGKARLTIHATAPGGLVDLEVDCNPPLDDPDTVGFHFTIDAPSLGLGGGLARAGYVRVRTGAPAGPITITLDASSGPASCSARLTPAPTGCGQLTIFRSVNVDHAHVPTSTVPSSWEPFPVSGDHYPTWAAWNTTYAAAIRTGYLVHDLEHGGVVFSYACAHPADSGACTQAQADLAAARASLPSPRTLDTPDPSQPMLYAVRTWRWGLLADCYDAAEVAAFSSRHFRHGREDVDEDPVPPFDPTQ